MALDNDESEAWAQCKDMISGIFAGGAAKIIEYPFDTLKVLLQINPDRSFSTVQFTRNVIQKEGISRIYRGLSAPLYGSCLEYFTTFWMLSSNLYLFVSHRSPHSKLFELIQMI